MPAVRLLSALLSIKGLYAQTARPAFRPDRVIPSFGDTPLMLAPGMLVSIHGSDIGPAEGCRGYGDQRRWETLPADNPFHVWERIVLYSAPLRFGLERIAITQAEPAYAGMPVWVRVHTANDLQDRQALKIRPLLMDALYDTNDTVRQFTEIRAGGLLRPGRVS